MRPVSTRVEPARLFNLDDAGGGPPADAVDVQFRAPLSLSLFADALRQAGRDLDLRTLFSVHQRVVDQTVTELQYEAGYVLPHGRTSFGDPARLELGGVGEGAVPGIDTLRLHCHVYVGRTAVTLVEGSRWPVDLTKLTRVARSVLWPFYLNRLEAAVALACGVTWDSPRPGATREIVDPPFHEHLAGHDRGVCPGLWGPRELLMADEESLRAAAERERQIAAERARGIVY